MKIRFVGLLVAVLVGSASVARAQERTLTAFRSDREFARYLNVIHPPPPPPPPANATARPLPPGSYEGPAAQWPVVITGRITNGAGGPESAVLVRIESLNAGTSTGADGGYRLVIPRARFQPGASAVLTTSRVGLEPVSRMVTLRPGTQLALDLQVTAQVLNLESIVVAGSAGAATITNNQTAGVDEGGIVKVHGDHLVMLRRGRLFTVDVGGGRLEPVDAVDAFGPETDPNEVWYDELLLSGDNVVVIGYSYARGGTEIGLFSIDRRGQLRHRSTYHIRSYDYYSSSNYASRLVGGKLILYAPVAVGYADDIAEWVPAVRRWHPGAEGDEFRRTLRPTRVYRPGRTLDDGDFAMLHTVTTCDLDGGELDCESAAVLGPEGRVFYVSATAVYIWTADWSVDAGPRRASSMVYRMPLDGSAPTALGVEGAPVNQFSFLESDDRHLNVLVRSEGMGEGMWGSEWADGDVRLLRVPLDRFGDGRRAAPRRAYTVLPAPDESYGDEFANRFVGRHLLYGEGSGWGSPRAGGSMLTIVRWRDGELAQMRLPHGVDRIEVMGGDAVVVGADTADLYFTGVRLAGEPRIAQRYVQRGASQGETRSHGFFYRADGPDEGVLGLPVRGPGAAGAEQLFEESASILFLRNDDAQFRPLGQLAAHDADAADDGCVASCVDWYGNARPIFLRGRTFALLGYELVEGALDDGRLREVRRVNFAPHPKEAAAR